MSNILAVSSYDLQKKTTTKHFPHSSGMIAYAYSWIVNPNKEYETIFRAALITKKMSVNFSTYEVEQFKKKLYVIRFENKLFLFEATESVTQDYLSGLASTFHNLLDAKKPELIADLLTPTDSPASTKDVKPVVVTQPVSLNTSAVLTTNQVTLPPKDKVVEIKLTTAEILQQMRDNVEKMLERDEKIEVLLEKTEKLAQDSNQFTFKHKRKPQTGFLHSLKKFFGGLFSCMPSHHQKRNVTTPSKSTMSHKKA